MLLRPWRGISSGVRERRRNFLLAVRVAFTRIAAHQFPHRVLYLINDSQIVVFAVMPHRRDYPDWLERLE